MALLSVVIVSYNVRYYLAQCLKSVARAAEGVDCEIIVVDNDSSDGTPEYISSLFPNVRMITSCENLGFSKANNLAVRSSEGKYLLFLNPDTIVSENVLTDCIRFMDNHPKAGMTGVCMLNRDGTFARESRRAIPTPFVSFCKMSGLCALFPKSRIFGKYYMGYTDKREAARVEVVSGAFMFVRREAFDSVGGFDETFFMYGEDIDLSFRVLRAGYENWYIPSKILHYKGESTNKTSFGYAKTFYNAMQIFFDKHYVGYNILFKWAVHVAVPVKMVMAFFYNNLHHGCQPCDEVRRSWQYCGHQEYVGRVENLTGTEKGSMVNYRMSLPTVSQDCDYTVYDISAFKFSEILDNISANEGRFAIATFSPADGILLTDTKVMCDGENASV